MCPPAGGHGAVRTATVDLHRLVHGMRTISQREMRHESGRGLRDAEQGGGVHGHPPRARRSRGSSPTPTRRLDSRQPGGHRCSPRMTWSTRGCRRKSRWSGSTSMRRRRTRFRARGHRARAWRSVHRHRSAWPGAVADRVRHLAWQARARRTSVAIVASKPAANGYRTTSLVLRPWPSLPTPGSLPSFY
jgi:hypothetical protein